MNTAPKHFFIIGAAKCGTSSLYYYLNQHPDILMSTPKETLFFEKEYNRGIAYFKENYFPDFKGEAFLGEGRHRNLFLPFVPERMAESFPNAKLIITLRNPVVRAYSHYLHRKNRGVEPLKFKEALQEDLNRIKKGILFTNKKDIESYINQLASDGASLEYRTYLDCGYYAEQIERYLNFFDKNQIFITYTNELNDNPVDIFSRLLKFINIDLQPVGINFSKQNTRTNRLNIQLSNFISKFPAIKTLVPKNVKNLLYSITEKISNNESELDNEMRAWLISHYLEHNKKLERLLGKDFSHWNH